MLLLDHAFTHTVQQSFQQSMDAVGKFLLLLGWAIYWLKTMNQARIEAKAKKQPYLKDFFADNVFEIPISCLALISLVFIAPYVSVDVMDLRGKVSLFLIGLGGGSIINSLITAAKPSKSKDIEPQPVIVKVETIKTETTLSETKPEEPEKKE